MAAPGKDDSSNVNTIVKEQDSRLDVLSPSFDPLSALYSSDVVVPYPDVKVFSNLSEYERKTKEGYKSDSESESKNAQGDSEPNASSSSRKKTKFRFEGAAPKAMKTPPGSPDAKSKPRVDRNVLTFMEKTELTGPMNLLQRCLQERHHVRVWTRSAVSIRGICRGYIVAFDKHFNLAMIDVDEYYKNPCIDKKKRKKLKDKANAEKQDLENLSTAGASKMDTQNSILECEAMFLGIHPTEVCYRHVNQIFIRGDNIACVNIIQR